jgi:protein-export membrane protein SecD
VVNASRTSRQVRLLSVVAVVLVLSGLVMLGAGAARPRLAIDLAGGTSITLTARPDPGEQRVTPAAMAQAVKIIRQRVNGSGVSEAEVATRGHDQILVTVPGRDNQDLVNLVGQTALLRFRPVLAQAGPQADQASPPAGSGPELDRVPAELRHQFATHDCTDPAQRQGGDQAPPDQPVVACDRDGTARYLLGPTAVEGTDLASAKPVSPRTATGRWQVNLSFDTEGSRHFSEITRQVVGATPPGNEVAIVLDGVVVSAPRIQSAITGGRAQITGDFTRDEAEDLANVLTYGALPLAFDRSQVSSISPTLGADQLRAGLLAGAIGLTLVAGYCVAYYRRLGAVAVASLALAGLLAYAAVCLLGLWVGYRLSLAGVAGMIVAVGITADSFVVYFERLRDELREGRSFRSAVEPGWVRARRTIVVADMVSLLAAVVLYQFSVDEVKGFAFTLGLTTLIDLAVVLLFTKPLLTLVARNWTAASAAATGLRTGGLGARLYRGDLGIVANWRRWLAASAVVLTVAVAGLASRGLDLGVEFTGGAVYQTRAGGTSVPAVREAVAGQGVADPLVRTLSNGDILVETGRVGTDQAQQVQQAVAQSDGARQGDHGHHRAQLGRGRDPPGAARPGNLPRPRGGLPVGGLRVADGAGGGGRAAARPAHHGRGLRPGRFHRDAGDGDRRADHPRVLALRHRGGLRQGQGEHQGHGGTAPDVRAGGRPRPQPDAGPLPQHLAGRAASGGRDPVRRRRPARCRHAQGPGARAVRGDRGRHVLVAVHRRPVAGAAQADSVRAAATRWPGRPGPRPGPDRRRWAS